MTEPTEHSTRLVKHNRGPALDPHWFPMCDSCDPKLPTFLAPAMDRGAAKEVAARHKRMGAFVGIAGGAEA